MDSGKQSWTVETFPEFLNPALLSNVAVFMKDTVRRRTNMKGPVEHGSSFTGNDVVVSSLGACRFLSSSLTGLTEFATVYHLVRSTND